VLFFLFTFFYPCGFSFFFLLRWGPQFPLPAELEVLRRWKNHSPRSLGPLAFFAFGNRKEILPAGSLSSPFSNRGLVGFRSQWAGSHIARFLFGGPVCLGTVFFLLARPRYIFCRDYRSQKFPFLVFLFFFAVAVAVFAPSPSSLGPFFMVVVPWINWLETLIPHKTDAIFFSGNFFWGTFSIFQFRWSRFCLPWMFFVYSSPVAAGQRL